MVNKLCYIHIEKGYPAIKNQFFSWWHEQNAHNLKLKKKAGE